MNIFYIAMNALLLKHPNLKIDIKIAYNKLKNKPAPKTVEEAMKMFYKEMRISGGI